MTNKHAQIYSKEFQRYESSRTSKFEHITTTNEPKKCTNDIPMMQCFILGYNELLIENKNNGVLYI